MAFGPWRPDEAGKLERKDQPGRSTHRAPRINQRALETPADRQRVNKRIQVLEWMSVALVLGLLLGFWQTQIVRGGFYSILASNNFVQRERIRPARGLILARDGTVLAANEASYEVTLLREATDDETGALEFVAGVLGEPVERLLERLETQRDVPSFRPVIVASDVDRQQVIRIEARRREYPGVQVQVRIKRHYPLGGTAAHILGHVGEISPAQLDAWDERYRAGDIVGKLGLESVYNDDLSGVPGTKVSIVNNVRREIGVREQTPPLPGDTVILTIDADLQTFAEGLLQGRKGAIVAIDVASGGILAMASAPTFDPNAFAARFSLDDWQALQTDAAKPMSNRALLASDPPGSIFKLVMAAAGLEEGIIDANTTFFCPGGRTFYGHFYGCLGQHGNVNVVEAIARSCNSFFYELGVTLGRERIVKWAERFGLGAPTGVDLGGEHGGIIPSDAWLAAQSRRYYAGETVSLAIGQGLLTVSPLQLAQVAAIATSGFVREPHLLAKIEASSSASSGGRTPTAETAPAAFSESTRRLLVRGMLGSVNYGSSQRARLPGLEIGAKTGTAQAASRSRVAEDDADRPEHLRNHAWFVGVAPLSNPEIAVVVFLEHGGSGGRNAAPVGAEVLAHWFGVQVPPPTPPTAPETVTPATVGEQP